MCHHVGLFDHPVWDILCFLDVNFLHQVREVLNSFLAVLGLCCCMQAFSCCGEQELLSSCNARASQLVASLVVAWGSRACRIQ